MRINLLLGIALCLCLCICNAQPSLLPGHGWSTNDFSCPGTSFTTSLNFSYNGNPPVAPGDFFLSTSPSQQIWWIQFGTSIQIATSNGCWTLLSGTWFSIPNCNYAIQASYQLATRDEATDECLIESFGRTYDITSGPCALASALILLKVEKPECRARFARYISHDANLGNGRTALGNSKVIPLAWWFDQNFAVTNAGGDFAFDTTPSSRHHFIDGQCTLSFTAPSFLSQIPANAPSLYSILPLPIWNCNPPKPPVDNQIFF